MIAQETSLPFAFENPSGHAPKAAPDRRNLDSQTGMMSRGRMVQALGEAMMVASRDVKPCAFALAAIKNLAVVNEAYGFEVADEVVVAMGQRLRRLVRRGDAIARYSGGQFGFILNDCREADLSTMAERMLEASRDFVTETRAGPVWALLSIGAAALPMEVTDPHAALVLAEEALAEARRLPSDGYIIHESTPMLHAARQSNTYYATEIVRCLREDRFKLAFQPVVSAQTGEVAFHEALLRMAGKNDEIIPASHLIPIAEKMGLVRLIDRNVTQMAIATLRRHPEARIAINISGTTATDHRWYPQITALLAASPEAAARMTVEITETVALGDLEETVRFTETLRALGTGVAIDDFGAGFTSFRHLRKLPVDYLKLDGSFCRGLAANADNRYFVRSLIDMARAFNFRTVAEWVETAEDAAQLREWKVDFLQGNYIGEPSLKLPWPEEERPEAFTA